VYYFCVYPYEVTVVSVYVTGLNEWKIGVCGFVGQVLTVSDYTADQSMVLSLCVYAFLYVCLDVCERS